MNYTVMKLAEQNSRGRAAGSRVNFDLRRVCPLEKDGAVQV
jgi:hypothetical protein